jgi:hypothetical protein
VTAQSTFREPPALTLNHREKIRFMIRRFGHEQQPVLVADEVLANPDAIRAYALGTDLRAVPSPEPCYQAPCTLPGGPELRAWVARTLCDQGFGLDPEPHLKGLDGDSSFHLFAPSADRKYGTIHLGVGGWIVIVLGLKPREEESSGTGFWRHAPTRIESAYAGDDALDSMLRIDDVFGTKLFASARIAHAHAPDKSYPAWVRSLLHAAPSKPPFPVDDHGPWERIGAVSARYNRLIAFPSWMFQSVLMKRRGGTSLETARLTLNGVLRHPRVEPRERLPAELVPGLEI